jgi:hypothetical protein
MTVYTFTAAVDSLNLNDTALLDALHSDELDVYPSSIDGAVSIEFEVDAESGEDAVRRAVDHFYSAAPRARIVRFDEDIVTATEISDRLSVSRETVRLWATGARRDGFPRARSIISGGTRLWTWASVYAWAESTGKLPAGEPCPVDDASIDWINGQLASHIIKAYIPIAGRSGAPSPFVAARQQGITHQWDDSGLAHPSLDEFESRDGARWVHDGRSLLKTANKRKPR